MAFANSCWSAIRAIAASAATRRITDRIQVTLVDPLRLTFQSRLHKVGGTFHVAPSATAPDGAKGGVFYHLEADYLK